MNLRNKLKDFSPLDQVKFSLFCAKQVSHLSSDPRVKATLSAAEAWVEDPSEDNRLKCKEAATDAWVVADAAAWAAAAWGAWTAWTAWTTDAAVSTAYWTIKANAELTEEGLFSSWLMSLVIEG